LSTILNPATARIGNPEYLRIFVDVLRQNNKNIEQHEFTREIAVEQESNDKNGKESGKIDILIHDRTHGIIIENKLNYASDQADQLARYVQIAKNNGIDVLAIVYLPAYQKQPPLETYSKDYAELMDEINQKLVVLPAVKLAEEFLDKCTEASSTNETARVYIDEYSRVLKDLGGNAMTNEIDLKLLREIYSNSENLVAAKNIADVWGKKKELVNSIFKDALLQSTDWQENEDKTTIGKTINDGICVTYWMGDHCLGFTSYKKKLTKETRTKLETILCQAEFQKYFDKVHSDLEEIYVYFQIDDFKGNLDEMTAFIVEKCQLLEKRVKDV
jgi:hypothetical protein